MSVKFVGFDWDGTLARAPVKHSWTAIDTALGRTAEMNALEERYLHGEMDYLEWCIQSIDAYIRFGLTEKVLREIDDKTTLCKGALETINELKSKGIKVCIISGGIYNFYEYLSRRFGFSMDCAIFATTFKFDKTGALVGGDYGASARESKLRVLQSCLKKLNVAPSEAVYVGDSRNDIPLFKYVTGIAFSSDSEELKKAARYIIEGEDLREILKYVI